VALAAQVSAGEAVALAAQASAGEAVALAVPRVSRRAN